MGADFSNHPNGTNKERAMFSCLRLFAVAIRHHISHPQRTPKSSTNVTAKFLKPAKLPQRLRRPTLRWLRSFLLSKCYQLAKGIFSCVYIRLEEYLTNDHLLESSSFFKSSMGYEKREKGRVKFFIEKSSICKKKRSFMGKLSRIAGNDFRITTIHTTFASNI